MVLEICIDSVESALAAQEGGAARVELCADLAHGGITPSEGMIRSVREHVSIQISAMIRPRAGGFWYSDLEFDVMKRDVEKMKQLGVDGVALGLLTADGAVDIHRTRILVQTARPLFVTFHRAFDECKDLVHALDDLKGLGIERVLTSGGKKEISEGMRAVADLGKRARGSIKIMAGGGVTCENVMEVVTKTNVDEIHVLTAVSTDSPQRSGSSILYDAPLKRVDASKVRKLTSLLDELAKRSGA